MMDWLKIAEETEIIIIKNHLFEPRNEICSESVYVLLVDLKLFFRASLLFSTNSYPSNSA